MKSGWMGLGVETIWSTQKLFLSHPFLPIIPKNGFFLHFLGMFHIKLLELHLPIISLSKIEGKILADEFDG